MKAEFQRIASRDEKDFPSDQCNEIEENNRIGKAIKKKNNRKEKRDLFEKIRDTKGPFHAKMGTIKDRNSLDLEKQKKLRSGKNTQKNYTKKILSTRITTMV